MDLAVDYREAECIPFLTGWTPKNLPVGDFWIGLSGEVIVPGGIVIERKQIADLEASIKDGRYREQRTRLQAFAQQYNANVAYIIEGDLDKTRGFTKQVLWKWLVRLPFVHKIPLLQTRSPAETADLLLCLHSAWKDKQADYTDKAKVTEYITTIKQHTKGEQRDDPRIFAITVLSACKGISPGAADAILKGCGGSLTDVWNSSVDTIAGIQNGKVKVGQVKAKKLFDLLHSV